MKICILHIGNYLLDCNSGVSQKTLALWNALREHKITTRVVNFSLYPINSDNPQIIQIGFNKNNKWEIIHDWISQNISGDEFIWMRYVFADQNFYHFSKRWGHKIWLEHNTLEEEEVLNLQRVNWKSLQCKISKSYLKYTIETWIKKNTDESRWGFKILQNCLGGICVTNEIAAYEQSRHSTYPTFVLPNSITENKVHFNKEDLRSPCNPNNHQKWVMVIGSMADWHGIDRLLRSVEKSKLPTGKKITIDLIGVSQSKLGTTKIPKNIQINFIEKLSASELSEQLKNYHLAIGSLAFYKININEACPLKVRDYWKNGLPVLLCYEDTSCIEHPALLNYNYLGKNDRSKIDLVSIFQFVENLYGDEWIKYKIFQWSMEHLTYQKKIPSLIVFLQGIISNQTK